MIPEMSSPSTMEHAHEPHELAKARHQLLQTLYALVARKQKEEDERAAVQAWAETLEKEIRAYRKWKRKQLLRWVYRIALSTLLLHLLLQGHADGAWWILFFIGGEAAVDAAADTRRQAAYTLARARDPRATSVLAVAARDGDRYTREVAIRGLKSILPTLKASDAKYMTSEGKEALLSLLHESDDPQLLTATLQALEQIGGQRDIPFVQPLTQWKLPRTLQRIHLLPTGLVLLWLTDTYSPQSAEEEHVREAARNCLLALQERAEQERLRNTLLRPAQAHEDLASVLPRPVQGSSETPPNMLLRPVNTNKEEVLLDDNATSP
jgi:hypothetical protein